MNTASILGVQFHAVTKQQAVELAMSKIRSRQKGYVVTPNPEIVDLCRHDEKFMGVVNHATLVLPDGIRIIYAAKILGEKLQGKVAGIEFAESLVAAMAKENMRLYLLGAKPGVAEKAGANLCAKYPGLVLAGTHDGYFSDPQEVVDSINAAGGADVVFVCLGAPKQEKFIADNMDDIHSTLFCGLGGSLDVFAGVAKRAPDIFIKLGLEWFYRLLKQPSRIGRMMKLPKFLLIVIKERLFGRKGSDKNESKTACLHAGPGKAGRGCSKELLFLHGRGQRADGLTEEKTESFVNMLSRSDTKARSSMCRSPFAIEGVSRSLLAQITRHRIASFSVQSQRYVREGL